MDRRNSRDSLPSGPSSLAVFVALAVAASLARAQETRWTVQGKWDAEEFGSSVAWVGDWDGDGLQDFATGSTGSPNGDPDFMPRVVVVSSATGMPLQVVSNDWPNSRFGDRLFAIGDADGDGRTELVVSSLGMRDPDTASSGEVLMWDSTGRKCWSWPPSTGSVTYPAVVGDLDGDSILDVIIRRLQWMAGGLDVVSGATGQLIRTHPDPSVGEWGTCFGALRDVDGDGVRDYLVEEFPGGPGKPETDVHAISGATGNRLWKSRLRKINSVVAIDDLDHDGIGDALLFAGDATAPFATGWVLSGASGIVLHALGGHDFIRSAVVAGDLDGDGVDDVVGINWKSPRVELVAYSPPTGLEIAREEVGSFLSYDLDGGVDFDGDGHVDLLCGFPLEGRSGRVKVVGLGGWNDLLDVDGDLLNTRQLGNATALVPDRDGDGAPEILAATVSDVDGAGNHVKILSSRDGHELARVAVAGAIGLFALPLIGVPDVDGDHVDDWTFVAADRTVEVRSGRDDALIRTWSLAAGEPGGVAAGVDAAGHSFAAFATFEAPDKGEIAIHDLTTGAPPLILKGKRWSSLACLGDLDGDTVLDWVACDVLDPLDGRLSAYSGATGTRLWTGAGKSTAQIRATWRVDDLSGDGKDDVLVRIESFGPMFSSVVVRNGATGAKLFELPDPFGSSTGFGGTTTALGDLDHDGWGDFAVGASSANHEAGFVDLYSGKTARLLRRIDGAPYSWFGGAFASVARGTSMFLRSNGRRQPALLANAPGFGEKAVGRVDLIALSDLFLELEPPVADEGQFVSAFTRGGKPGALTGLYLVAVDGVAVDQFGAFGFLDSFGEWTTGDVIPTGFSGTEFTLRSYAVGIDGKLSYSTRETLTIW